MDGARDIYCLRLNGSRLEAAQCTRLIAWQGECARVSPPPPLISIGSLSPGRTK